MDLNRLLAPRDPALATIALELHESRPDLQSAFPDPASEGYRRWLAVHGVLEDERIAAAFPPVPPPELRSTVCGGGTPKSHLYTGLEDFRTVAELFAAYADRPIESVRSVLDFGCGCGRLLRWFQTTLPTCRLIGADVRQASIAWCRDHLAGQFLANGTEPPLDLPDATVDLAVALSVFSHLSLDQNLRWMAELVRVTKPGGFVVVSTHGAFALAVTLRSKEHQNGLAIRADEVPALLRALARDGFLQRPGSPEAVRRADGVADDYGQAFLTEQFAREHWAPLADVVGCVPVALNLFQDVHVLRRR